MSLSFGSLERQRIIFSVFLIFTLIYIFRLFQLQILENRTFEEKSSDNSIKAVEETPLRGVFYDRNGRLLVENTPTYTVQIIPADYDTSNNNFLENILSIEKGTIKNLLFKNRQYSKFVPLKVKRGVSFESIAWIEENFEKLPGVKYIIEMQRGYLDSIMASHLYGYTKEISPKQLKEDSYYTPGDLVGYNGLERKYEKILRGKKGYQFIVVDSKRREVTNFQENLKNVPSIKGEDLLLGIDADAQKAAEEGLQGYSGAVVAIEPSSGEIIALASSPNYNLNEFSYFTPRSYIQQLYSDPQTPLFNRATMAAHPPGSTFKILCAIAALELGVIQENTTLPCGGGFTFGRYFKCHGAHGAVNVVHAIEKSCNTFFYQLIFKIGLDRLEQFAKRFGLGQKTGIDIMEEATGLIPNSKFYEKRYGPDWPKGILVSLGIGQGEISVTPLQLALYAALIANNGKSYYPHVAKGTLDENKKFKPFTFQPIDTKVSQKTFEIVKKGMFLVVQGAGTATNIKMTELHISGKTGTAQNPHGKDHSLFIAFAPSENPAIAIAVLVENVGFGATYAAPIAQRVIKAYLQKEKKTEGKSVLQSLTLR